jgi:hypothetical protein
VDGHDRDHHHVSGSTRTRAAWSAS